MKILTGLSSLTFIPYQGFLLANTKQKPENKEASIQTRLLHLRAVEKESEKQIDDRQHSLHNSLLFLFFDPGSKDGK